MATAGAIYAFQHLTAYLHDATQEFANLGEAMQITRGNANGGVITVSIGYDIRYATEDVSLQGLYGRADRALFRAKQEGRNCIRSSYDLRERRSKIG